MAEEELDSDENMDSDSEDDSDDDSESDEPVNEKITLKARKDRRSSGKWKLLCDRKVFKKEWLNVYPWIEEDSKDPKLAICKICNTTMKALKGILETHQKSKKHMKNFIGPDYVEEPKKDDRAEPKVPAAGIDQITEEQISFFAESQADAAHQAVTSIIDKLVEKYHENRLKNLKVQNEAVFQLNVERAKVIRSENQRKLERRLQQEAYMKEAEEARLKFLQIQHDSKINAIEDEKVAKLRAMEQGLVFAKQEYEKKMKFLDSQISSMK